MTNLIDLIDLLDYGQKKALMDILRIFCNWVKEINLFSYPIKGVNM